MKKMFYILGLGILFFLCQTLYIVFFSILFLISMPLIMVLDLITNSNLFEGMGNMLLMPSKMLESELENLKWD